MEITHPYLDITTVDLVEFYGMSHNPEANLKNVLIFGDAQVDRSPCGTGTSAKLVHLYEKGKIGLNKLILNNYDPHEYGFLIEKGYDKMKTSFI
nr:proline racemase family protein [Clostridium kluyveri]